MKILLYFKIAWKVQQLKNRKSDFQIKGSIGDQDLLVASVLYIIILLPQFNVINKLQL